MGAAGCPGGRADPFAPLVGVEAADAQDPTTGHALTGVLLVVDQKRAIVTNPTGSDMERGCIRLALNDEPQDPLCIA